MCSDVRDGEHRNDSSGLAPSGVQHSAIGANHDYRSQPCFGEHRNGHDGSAFARGVRHSAMRANRDHQHDVRIVPPGGPTTHTLAGEHRNGDDGSAYAGGVRHSAMRADHVHRSQMSFVGEYRNENDRFAYASGVRSAMHANHVRQTPISVGERQGCTGLVSSGVQDSANTRSGHQSQYGIRPGEEHMDLSVNDIPQVKRMRGAIDAQSLATRDENTMVSSEGHERHAPGGPAYSGVQHSASAAGSGCHDVRQFRNARDGSARSGVPNSANASPNHAALVATSGPNGNRHEHGVVNSNGVQYSVNIPTYNRRDYRTRGQSGQDGVQFFVNGHHFDRNRNICHDAIRITYAPPALDVSRGGTRSAITIGFDPSGLDVSRGSGCSAFPIGCDHHGADGRYQFPGAGGDQGSRNASGSANSPGSNCGRHGDSTSESRQLVRDLSGMMSSPEGARAAARNGRQAFQIPAGGAERSFQELDARESRGALLPRSTRRVRVLDGLWPRRFGPRRGLQTHR
jgi:hypothetical protein